jgi:hypothetical protein
MGKKQLIRPSIVHAQKDMDNIQSTSITTQIIKVLEQATYHQFLKQCPKNIF